MRGPSLRAYVICAGTLVLGIGCSSATAPAPGILVVEGAGQSDSVESVLPQAVVIRVLAPPGHSGASQIVQFQSITNSDFTTDAYVLPPNSLQPNLLVVDTTDNAGQASVRIQLGTVAGPARVIVAAPSLGYVDTVSFTVLPGAATGITGGPADSAIYVNGTETLHAQTTDQFGNLRTGDAITYAIASGPATLSGVTLTGSAIGRVAVAASFGPAHDTIFTSVVPRGTLAASVLDTAIVMFNLDGSNYATIARVAATVVKWDPTGTSVVYNNAITNLGGGPGGRVYLVSTSGVTSVVDAPPSGYLDTWPDYSRDGTWIYFARYTPEYLQALWRIHPDGTGADSLQVNLLDNNYMPSPSPDGSQLAYVGGTYSGVLRILTIATGAVVDPEIPGFAPKWSPNSDLIAYIASGTFGGPLAVIHADGTGSQIISPPNAGYGMGIDWSPDGQWVVAQRNPLGPIDLINVSTGLDLPLGYTSGFGSPTWRPGSSDAGTAKTIRRGPTGQTKTMRTPQGTSPRALVPAPRSPRPR